MELELGLKITRDADDQRSTNFRIAKDRAGPVFVSSETDSVYILSAHLKGFERENIKININEDGSRITISGEKLVQETIMRGWRVYKKEEEIRGFRKTFKIPDGVVLDRIRAKFGTGKPSLTIYMPKSEKGIRGLGIEEVKEEEDGERGHEKEELMKPPEKKHEDNQLGKGEPEKPPLRKLKQPDEAEEEAKAGAEGAQHQMELGAKDETRKTGVTKEETPGGSQIREALTDQAESSIQKEGEQPGSQAAPQQTPEKKSGFFAPGFLTGSALIASLVVLVVGLVRSKRQ